MRSLHLITVGKLSDKNYAALENNYLKQLRCPPLSIHELKSQEEKLDLEAEVVLKKVLSLEKKSSAHVVLLTERGKQNSSPNFASWFEKLIHNGNGPLILIIGGASGHGQKVYDRANEEISLSKLTFPHKMARLVIIEQLYRAQTILAGHPYHK
ncbi:MAG: 23S rRNA (pseudouridine(1915)-N(3))-methyltransferase RlmH [Lentisphaeria bacterium]|nr:23S rRNA (pseudouridine(1915)-N(3))-methyltransferase RlmH [Lentisphaeria bacterium]